MQLKSSNASTAGTIVLGGKSFIMDHEMKDSPGSWTLKFIPGISCFVLLRDHEGNICAYVASLTDEDGAIKPSTGWFGTPMEVEGGCVLHLETARALGIENMSDRKQTRLASDIVARAYAAWTQCTQDEVAA